jgi:hypothetical protein
MQKTPHQHLRLCILTLNAAHIKASYRFTVYVGHGAKLAKPFCEIPFIKTPL